MGMLSQRHVMWSPWTNPGLEHLSLTQNAEQIIADGWIIV